MDRTGKDLLQLTNARAFFKIGDSPGIILMDSQAWVFDRSLINPHPISRSEILKADGVTTTADDVADLLTSDEWNWIKESTSKSIVTDTEK